MNNYLILAGAILFLIAMFFVFKNILTLGKEGVTKENKHQFVYLYFIFGILSLIIGILRVSIGERNLASYSEIVVGLIFLWYGYKNRK